MSQSTPGPPPKNWPKCLKIFKIENLIAVLALVVAVLALRLQAYRINGDYRIDSFGQIYSQMIEIDKIFLDHPELRLYIYNNMRPEDLYPERKNTIDSQKVKQSKTQLNLNNVSIDAYSVQRLKDQAAASAIAELMLDFFSLVILEMPNLGNAGNSWRNYIKDIYKCSPVVRDCYERKFDWYGIEIPDNIIAEAKAELSKGVIACDNIKIPTK